MADGIQIEERVELIKELEEIKRGTENNIGSYTHEYLSKETVSSLPTPAIKGILFEYYESMNNYLSYNNINEYSIRYKSRINQNLTEEEYVIREGIFEKIEYYY